MSRSSLALRLGPAFVFIAGSILVTHRTPEVLAAAAQEKLSAGEIQRLAGWKSYKALCADCHGEKGDGRGPLRKTMTPEPANYQNCDVLSRVSDEQIRTIILGGSEAIGKSDAMPGFKKKIGDPSTVDQLIEVVPLMIEKARVESRAFPRLAPEEARDLFSYLCSASPRSRRKLEIARSLPRQ